MFGLRRLARIRVKSLKSILSKEIGRYELHLWGSLPGLGNTTMEASSIEAGIGWALPNELKMRVRIGARMWQNAL